MKKVLSERNLVVVLFVAALTIFSFAQEDAKKAEKVYQGNAIEPLLLAAPKQTANNIAPTAKTVSTTPLVK